MMPWPQFIADTEDEAEKLFLLRLVVAGILIYRESFVAAALDSSLIPVTAFHPVYILALAVCLFLGFATRFTYLMLAVCLVPYNAAFHIMNLGPLVTLPLLWCGLLLDRQPIFSLDGKIVARWPQAAKILCWHPTPNVATFNFVYGIVFLVYAVNSFGAIVFHLQDPYWRSGQTVQALFVNNFLSSFFMEFRSIEAHQPLLLQSFSLLAVILQTVFQLFMVPLVFWKWGRWFVVLHGFGFFLVSLLDIQISVLPAIELSTWLLLFCSWIRSWRTMPCVTSIVATPVRMPVTAVFMSASLLSISQCLANAFHNERMLFLGPEIRNGFKNIGIWPPNVFNANDLKMGETWFVLYRVLNDGQMERVPIFAENGARLGYHRSDLVYFGNTLHWRRASINVKWPSAESEKLLDGIRALCEFDLRLNRLSGPQRYVAKVFQDSSMDLSLELRERYTPRLLTTREFTFD